MNLDLCGVRPYEDGPLLLEPRELYDAAILGWARRSGDPVPIAIYDAKKLVECLMKEGFGEEEALEWIGFNIEPAWLGRGTPMILHRLDPQELDEQLAEL